MFSKVPNYFIARPKIRKIIPDGKNELFFRFSSNGYSFEISNPGINQKSTVPLLKISYSKLPFCLKYKKDEKKSSLMISHFVDPFQLVFFPFERKFSFKMSPDVEFGTNFPSKASVSFQIDTKDKFTSLELFNESRFSLFSIGAGINFSYILPFYLNSINLHGAIMSENCLVGILYKFSQTKFRYSPKVLLNYINENYQLKHEISYSKAKGIKNKSSFDLKLKHFTHSLGSYFINSQFYGIASFGREINNNNFFASINTNKQVQLSCQWNINYQIKADTKFTYDLSELKKPPMIQFGILLQNE